jgi:hypothetical protein
MVLNLQVLQGLGNDGSQFMSLEIPGGGLFKGNV